MQTHSHQARTMSSRTCCRTAEERTGARQSERPGAQASSHMFPGVYRCVYAHIQVRIRAYTLPAGLETHVYERGQSCLRSWTLWQNAPNAARPLVPPQPGPWPRPGLVPRSQELPQERSPQNQQNLQKLQWSYIGIQCNPHDIIQFLVVDTWERQAYKGETGKTPGADHNSPGFPTSLLAGLATPGETAT